ncbi:hypothetical protein, partial [Limosilactobacillus reuteri]|uniref:hypothetical protein n=1 Tax=Limosilactobacillus reuteri TaxID=1598 RepID=UPI000BD1AA64
LVSSLGVARGASGVCVDVLSDGLFVGELFAARVLSVGGGLLVARGVGLTKSLVDSWVRGCV